MTAPAVHGLDLSLTSTGVAGPHGVNRIIPGAKTRGCARLTFIREHVMKWVDGAALVVIEGPAYAMAKGAGHHEAAGLWWLIALTLTEAGTPYAVASPQAVKKYATGKGNASKDQVLAAVIRRYPDAPITGNDEADAFVLAAMGLRWLGHPIEASLPAAHLAPLYKIEWPEVRAC